MAVGEREMDEISRYFSTSTSRGQRALDRLILLDRRHLGRRVGEGGVEDELGAGLPGVGQGVVAAILRIEVQGV